MKSIAWPKMFSHNSTNLVEDYDATLQNLKTLIFSEKGELFGDPYFGSSLRKYLYDQNDYILQDILLDDFYSTITLFMPQLLVDRKDISLVRGDKGSLTLNIKAMNRANFQTDLYSIVLLTTSNV